MKHCNRLESGCDIDCQCECFRCVDACELEQDRYEDPLLRSANQAVVDRVLSAQKQSNIWTPNKPKTTGDYERDEEVPSKPVQSEEFKAQMKKASKFGRKKTTKKIVVAAEPVVAQPIVVLPPVSEHIEMTVEIEDESVEIEREEILQLTQKDHLEKQLIISRKIVSDQKEEMQSVVSRKPRASKSQALANKELKQKQVIENRAKRAYKRLAMTLVKLLKQQKRIQVRATRAYQRLAKILLRLINQKRRAMKKLIRKAKKGTVEIHYPVRYMLVGKPRVNIYSDEIQTSYVFKTIINGFKSDEYLLVITKPIHQKQRLAIKFDEEEIEDDVIARVPQSIVEEMPAEEEPEEDVIARVPESIVEELPAEEDNENIFIDQLIELLNQHLLDETETNYILVRGKKQKAATKSQKLHKKKILHLIPQFNSQMESLGFQKEFNHDGVFVNFSRPFPRTLVNQFKQGLRKILYSSLFDRLRGATGEEHAQMQDQVQNIIDERIDSLSRLLKPIEKELNDIKNVKFTYRFESEEVRVVADNIHSFLRQIIKAFRRYQIGQDQTPSQARDQFVSGQVEKFSINILAVHGPAHNLKTKGQFLKDIIDHEWYVLNPNTKKHCVADCLAALELYRSDKQLVSAWGYIKKSGDRIAVENDICDGATNEQIAKLSEKHQVDVVFDVKQEGMFDRDAYLIIHNEHCVIALNPKNPRSKLLFDLCQRFNFDQQQLMKKWEPKPKNVYLAAFDWEWVVHEEQQLPYAFGIYYQTTEPVYHKHLQREGIYKKFADKLIESCEDIYQNSFLPEVAGQKDKKGKEIEPADIECIVNFIAFNGHKADYPLFEKFLLEDKRFTQTSQCASGQAKISYTYTLNTEFFKDKEIKLMFTDAINLFKGSLDGFGKAMGLDVEKQHCDHKAINIQNYQSEIKRQNIDYYLQMDCEVLYKAMMKYDELLTEQVGFSILKNSIMTQASLAEKIYFNQYFQDNIYTMPEQMMDFCRKAYKGALTDNFAVGEFDRVFSVDINSSYPFQMTKAQLPVGKAHMITLNRYYQKEPLQHGIYRVIVKNTPELRFPILCENINGQNLFPLFKNHETYITKEELEFATKRGYEIFLLDACICDETADIYGEYIHKAYSKRKQIKAEMKAVDKKLVGIIGRKCEKIDEYVDLASESIRQTVKQLVSEYRTLDALQEIEKLKMNSTYGKLAWASSHEITNYTTTDTKFLLEQFALGNINSIKAVNERYTMYSGTQVSGTSRTNFMIAAYITARARMQLVEALENVEKAGCIAIYGDTDSIFAQRTEKCTEELWNRYIAPMLDDSKLGGFKLEMQDKVGCDYSIGSFVIPKLYALKNPETGATKTTAKGIMQWLIADDEKSKQRREDECAEQIGYEDVAGLLAGIPIQFKRQQQLINKRLLSSNAENIKIQKEVETQVSGTLSKKLLAKSGLCVPLIHYGDAEIPYSRECVEKWLEFPKIEYVENHYNMKFDEVANLYCVLRNEQTNHFIVFQDPTEIPKYLQQRNNLDRPRIHQMFGKWMIPTFDVDCCEDDAEQIDMDIDKVVSTLRKKLCLDETVQVDVIDRCRRVNKSGEPEMKFSYHIRIPGFCIQRVELSSIVLDLAKEDRKQEKKSLISKLDACIYRTAGSLRITNNEIFYTTGLRQLQFKHNETMQRYTKIRESVTKKSTAEINKSVEQRVNEYLVKNNIKGWVFRDAKVFKNHTVANLNRKHGADTYCKTCDKHHTKDNTLYLKLTATKITEGCYRQERN